MQLLKFKDLKDKFPKESIVIKYWETSNPGSVDDMDIIYIDSDFETENINLDNAEATFNLEKSDNLLAIFVDGNLTTKNIFNEETDGATGIIVLGNLAVENMVVGGQEIYVSGNLEVKELFWGEYNHGDLTVEGTIKSHFFLCTNEYHYPDNIDQKNIDVLFLDESDDEYSLELLQNYFDEKFTNDNEDEPYSWDDFLDRTKIIEALEQNNSVLKNPFISNSLEIPKLFSSIEFNNEKEFQLQINNFKKIIDLVSDDFPEQQFRINKLSCDVFMTKNHKRESDNQEVPTSIMILSDDGFEIYLWQKQLNPLKSFIGKKTPLIAYYKNIQQNVFSQQNVFDNPELLTYVQKIWRKIITRAEKGSYYQNLLDKTVKPKDILEIVNLPIVTEKYNDWNDDDKHGDWFGNRIYSFCINGFDDTAATLRIGAEIEGEDFDARFYYYRNDWIENPKKVILKYWSSQANKTKDYYSDGSKYVSPFDWKKYKEAIQWIKKALVKTKTINQDYLDNKEEEIRNNRPLEERSNEELITYFNDHIFLNSSLFGNKLQIISSYDLVKNAPKQFVSFDNLNLSTNVIWKEDKTIGYGFNIIEDVLIQLMIIRPNNSDTIDIEKPQNCNLFIYHFNQEKDELYNYFIPNSEETIPTEALSKQLITVNNNQKTIIDLITLFKECEPFLESKNEEYKSFQKRNNVAPKPFETMLFEGHSFKVLNLHEANEIIGGLTDFQNEKIYDVYENTWRFPDYYDNSFFLLAEEDVTFEKFHLDYSTEEIEDIFILGFIFKQNLTVTTSIMAYDTDNSPALIVLGSVDVPNIKLFGNIHYIGNNLKCNTLWGFYNHGELFVKGGIIAWLIYTDDMNMHFGTFTATEAIISNLTFDIKLNLNLVDENNNDLQDENWFPSTHQLSAIVKDEYLEKTDYGKLNINFQGETAFEKGEIIVDLNKEDLYQYKNFKEDLKKIATELSEIAKTKETNYLSKTEHSSEYSFLIFEHENTTFHQVEKKIGEVSKIKQRIVYAPNDLNNNILLLEYLHDDETVKYQWSDTIDSSMLELRCVKNGVLEAYEKLIFDN